MTTFHRAQRADDVPAATSLPFRTRPVRVHVRADGEEKELRPFAIVLGGTSFPLLDTPEKISGLQKPMPVEVRHTTMVSAKPFDRYELYDYGPGLDGHPVHGYALVGEDEVVDLLGRVHFDLIVGYTPESIAEEVKQKVLAAFRKLPEYADGQFDRPIEVGAVANPLSPA